jgi:hypothetical protein
MLSTGALKVPYESHCSKCAPVDIVSVQASLRRTLWNSMLCNCLIQWNQGAETDAAIDVSTRTSTSCSAMRSLSSYSVFNWRIPE